MRLGVAVMAHPSRERMALALARPLHAAICWDDGSGERATGATAWEVAALGNPDWSIVLQDDAVPIGGFLEHAAEALEARSPALVSFYVGTGRGRPTGVVKAIEQADAEGAAWLECDALLWGVALALPTYLVPEMLSVTDQLGLRYDTRIGAWAHKRGIPIRYTWPSLVDHADVPSIAQAGRPRNPKIPGSGAPPPRRAHRVGAPGSWDTPAVQIAAQW